MMQCQQYCSIMEQSTYRNLTGIIKKSTRLYNNIIIKTVQYPLTRWLISLVFGFISIVRIINLDYLAILYFESLYILYLLVQYFTPIGLPDPDEDDFSLPIEIPEYRSFQGDKPILRMINQFSLWKSLTYIFALSYVCSLFTIFLIPVYWPFLIIYLVFLVFFALQKHSKHMQKYGYRLTDFSSKSNKSSVI